MTSQFSLQGPLSHTNCSIVAHGFQDYGLHSKNILEHRSFIVPPMAL